ncbi:MAG: ATP-dependent chaperone ClpB, partial [Leptolyngbyaceae cyanobacterium RM2_2_21]|nr:ATP-dependent chaperone ClpB [Leptolyngbyaceae cyanobacterium RM2_2_21]
MQPTDPDKFTDKAWEAIVEAQNVARRFKQQYLEVEHVIVALLEQEGLAHSILKRVEINPEVMLRELTVFSQRQARVRAAGDSNLYLGQSLDRLLDKADSARDSLKDKFISVEHLL